ncbi:MAG: hypothetical protein AAGD14_08120 [Planctomycetota bacterium]
MSRIALLTLVGLFAIPSIAEAQLVTAGQALDQKTCDQIASDVKRRIEIWTRMKYRKPVPVNVETKRRWEQRLTQTGLGGHQARQGLAYYNIIANRITVVPWVIGGYPQGPKDKRQPAKKDREEWINKLESIMIHELMHALHHQNFYVVLGGARSASLKLDGLTAEEKDISTVEFLIAEGMSELVSVRTATPGARTHLTRRPNRELNRAQRYWDRYQPDGKTPFRVRLSNTGYQHGLDILNKLDRLAGPRAIRGMLYRQPPRELFFQPELLAKMVDFDDPPDPDSIFAFLSPDGVKFGEVELAVWPGKNRFFVEATPGRGRRRAPGCLIGYTAEAGSDDGPHGRSNYSFFIADPDRPGSWSKEQAESLRQDEPGSTKEKKVKLPMVDGVKADLIRVDRSDGSVEIRAEIDGLVVCARESKPTSTLEDRVRYALRSLYIRRPKADLYTKALVEAKKNINHEKGD